MDVPEHARDAFLKLSPQSSFVDYGKKLSGCIILEDGDIHEHVHNFKCLLTNVQRLNFMYRQLVKYDLLGNIFTNDAKCDRKAIRHQRKADNNFSRGDTNKALSHWTRCIFTAKSQHVLAKAYANRSAGLFRMKLFKECLEDIDRALDNGYPQALIPHLYLRKEKAMELWPQTEELLYYQPTLQIPYNRQNQSIQYASDSVEVRRGENRKRIFATKDIRVGEVIGVEKPYAWVLSGVHQYHCSHCFELCYNLIPCQHCCQVGYCSEGCRDEAREQYHKSECPILISAKNLLGNERNYLLALKMTFLEVAADEEGAAADTSGLFRLVDDMHQPRSQAYYHTTALMGALLFNLVKNHSNKFDENEDPQVIEDFKDSLVKNIQLVWRYGSPIDELAPNPNFNLQDPNQSELMAFQTESVGCGLYTFCSLISHSCAPNVFVHHHGVSRIIRAIRTIRRGQELFISYGPNYVKDTLDERRSILKSFYGFICECRACENNWPTLDHRPYVVKVKKHLPLVHHIRRGNVNVTRYANTEFLPYIEALEQYEPYSDLTLYQKLLSYCYDIHGNKRRPF